MAATHDAIFCLSTGRCGTQWLQRALAATYDDVAVVKHEPVRGPYHPKRYLRAYDRLDELLAVPEVASHLASIKQTVRSKVYIETGWPCYPAIPMMVEQLGGRVRIVHLVRHPVHVALSLLTHAVYATRKDWLSGAAISPFDRGVVQQDLRDRWDEMGSYEKCLFWWTEINLYALELQQRHADVAFLVIRYEDLFDPGSDALRRLIRFMNLTYVPSIQDFRLENVDRYRRQSPPADWKLIFKNPRTVSLAERFGYRFDELSAAGMATRYFGR